MREKKLDIPRIFVLGGKLDCFLFFLFLGGGGGGGESGKYRHGYRLT